MAKLSKRTQKLLVADVFLMATATSEAERRALADKILNGLGIDNDEYSEGLEMFEYLQDKRNRRPAQPVLTVADICTVDENGELHTDNAKFDQASAAVRNQVLRYMADCNIALATGAPLPMPPGYKAPAPKPETTPADTLPTKRMRDSVGRFDQMADCDQIAWLRESLGL